MSNKDDQAFPAAENDYCPGWFGLTKREYFAALALEGLLSSLVPADEITYPDLAKCAVKSADALLLELEKQIK